MELLRKCVFCDNNEFFRVTQKEEYSIVKCSSCGLLFVNPRDEKNESQKQYSEDVTSPVNYYFRTKEADLRTFQREWEVIKKHISVEKGNLLDVGCSVGTFMEMAREQGWQVLGIEANSKAVWHARLSGLNVIEGFFEEENRDVLSYVASFDLVHMGDVIEHFRDPVSALRKARSLLKPGGMISITTPNFDSVMARLFQIKPKEHLFYFTAKTIAACLEKTGFRVKEIMSSARRRDIRHIVRGTTFRDNRYRDRILSFLFALLSALHLDRGVSAMAEKIIRDEMLIIAVKDNASKP